MKMEISTVECTDLVVAVMKKWPEDPYTQRGGVGYFWNIGTINSIKERVKEAKVLPVLANAVEVFRKKEVADYKAASETIKMYA